MEQLSSNSHQGRYTRSMYQVMTEDFDSLLRDYEGLDDSQRLGDWYLACVALAYLGDGNDLEAKKAIDKATESFHDKAARRVLAYTQLTLAEPSQIMD